MTREWKAGDRIELELPMEPQRVTADPRIQANAGLTALKYGPLVYNIEVADNQNIDRKLDGAALRAEWKPDLLGGVMVIQGKWADGSEFTAIPNYARMNRVGPPPAYPGEEGTDAGPGAHGNKNNEKPTVDSKVWI